MLASGGFEQLADRTNHAVPTVIESAGVHQRSERFSSVQMRNRILYPDSLLPRMPKPFTIGWADISRQRPGSCGCLIARRPRHPAAAGHHPFRSGAPPRTAPDMAERAGPAGRCGWPRGVTFKGIVRRPGRPTDRTAHRSIRVLAFPFPLPHSPSRSMRLGESVPAPERLSTSSASGLCPRPGQVQDRNPTQGER